MFAPDKQDRFSVRHPKSAYKVRTRGSEGRESLCSKIIQTTSPSPCGRGTINAGRSFRFRSLAHSQLGVTKEGRKGGCTAHSPTSTAALSENALSPKAPGRHRNLRDSLRSHPSPLPVTQARFRFQRRRRVSLRFFRAPRKLVAEGLAVFSSRRASLGFLNSDRLQ